MGEKPGNEELWTAAEVAVHLRIAKGTVDQWAKLGRIPVIKVGRRNRFRKSDIDRWLAQSTRLAVELEKLEA